MLTSKSIIIIGAGIGGLSAARIFAQRGADVTVLEQAEAITEVGAGLQISPNGFAVLDAMGLGERVARCSVQAEAVSLRDYRKGEVLRMPVNTDAPGAYHFLHRADLIELLAEGAREAGVKIRLLQRAVSVDPGTPATVHLANGARLSADLVIGADGLHSVVRPLLTPTPKPFFTGQVAWRAIVPNTAGQPNEVRLFMGPHRHVVLYPLRGGHFLNVVAVQERKSWVEEGWSVKADADDLRRDFADFEPQVQAVLAQIEKVHQWGLFRHKVAQVWHRPGVAMLGDAAHPTLPFMAQGANMALEDAWVLADEVECSDDLDAALAKYQQRRHARVCRVIEAANGNAWKYHLAFAPLRFVAHLGLRLMGRISAGRIQRQFDWLYNHDVTRDP